MATDFFKRQDDARRQTRWLVGAFALAIVAVVIALDLAVLLSLGALRALAQPQHHGGLLLLVTLIVLGTILGATFRKQRSLADGGPAVAREVGGVPVTRANQEPRKRQLLNVVEEMALAAGIPAPRVFVIPDQPGINAFAAGHSLDDAAIAVTSGALEKLDRDELQAVIGHEFSHVLNGDMRLNVQLIAWLYGLYAVTVLARRIMRRADGKRRALRVWLLGAAVLMVGTVGRVAARMLQAAVSRNREQLADASAVQFTRNPEALKRALLKIAGHGEGSAVQAGASLEIAHLFFASGAVGALTRFGDRLFATHPPLYERVHALDGSLTRGEFARLAREAAARVPAEVAAGDSSPTTAAASEAACAPAGAAPAAGAVPARAARPAALVAAVASAAAVRPAPADGPRPAASSAPLANAGPGADASRPSAGPARAYPALLPPDEAGTPEQRVAALRVLQSLAAAGGGAAAVAFAGALSGDPQRLRTQVAAIAKSFGMPIADAVANAHAQFARAPARGRLPAVLAALTTLAQHPDAERERLRRAIATLAEHGDAPSLLRVATARAAQIRLASAKPASAGAPLKAVLGEIGGLVMLVARFGDDDPRRQRRAYRTAMAKLTPGLEPPAYAPPDDWPSALARGCVALASLHPGARRFVRDTLAAAVTADGNVTCEESDLLRVACLALDVPMPDFDISVGVRTPGRADANGQRAG